MNLTHLGEMGRAREFLDQQAVLTVACLNFGDCFSYALAERLKVPLLFVGNDFDHTDLEAALG
jgi:uncharacterized protein with PIN domain